MEYESSLLSNPNLWNIGGFDYALANMNIIFLFI